MKRILLVSLLLAGSTLAAPNKESTRSPKGCDPKAKDACPSDQRCVKDGERYVCRPINDNLGGL